MSGDLFFTTMVLGKRCFYRKCGRYSVQYPDLIFFRFTQDPILRDAWIRNCGIEEGTNLSDAYVCETHFRNALTSDKILKKTAKPIPFSEKDSEVNDPISEFLAHSCKYCGSIFSTELTSTQHLFYCRSHSRYNEPISDPNDKTKKKTKIKCVVTRCNETFSSSRLFPLPSEPNLRKVWLQNVPVPIKYSPLINVFYVCEKHFSESDIMKDGDGVRLKEDAVPSGFNFPTVQDAGVQPCCVPTCVSNHSPIKTQPITTFPFPPDFQSLAREWQNILLKNFRIFIPNGSICRNHFKKDVVYISGKQSFLAHGAVPTILSKSVEKPVKFSFPADYDLIVNSCKKPSEAIIDITSDSEDDTSKKGVTENTGLVCCVPTCASTAVGARGFHVFPLPGETFVEVIYAQPPSRCATSGIVMDLLDLWKSRASVDEVTPMTVICTNHFTSSDYVQANQTLKLDKYALPSRRLAASFPPCMILPKEKDKIRNVTRPQEETPDENSPCSVTECFSHVSPQDFPGNRRKMFLLPNDINKAKEWATIFGQEHWLYNGLQWALENIRICSAHFKKCMFTDKMTLIKGALPFPSDPLGDGPKPTSQQVTEQTSQKKKLPNILSKTTFFPTSKNDESISSPRNPIYVLNCDPLALGPSEIEKPEENSQPSSFYVKCSVVSCNNYFDDTRGEYLGQSYFTFPEDPVYRKAWIKAIDKPYQWRPSKRSRICFRHFHTMDVNDGKLKPTAIPTLCLGTNLENLTEGTLTDSANKSSSQIAVTNPFETINENVGKRSGRKSVEKPREDYFDVESDCDKREGKKRGRPRKQKRTLPLGRRRKKQKTIPSSCSSIEEASEDKGNHFLSGQEIEENLTDFSDEIDLPEEPEIKLGEPSNCFIIKEETEEFDEPDGNEPQSDVKLQIKQEEFEEVVELSDTDVQESILSQSLMCDQSPAISEVDDFMEFCVLLKDDFLKLTASDKFEFITSMKKKMSDLLKKNYPKPYG